MKSCPIWISLCLSLFGGLEKCSTLGNVGPIHGNVKGRAGGGGVGQGRAGQGQRARLQTELGCTRRRLRAAATESGFKRAAAAGENRSWNGAYYACPAVAVGSSAAPQADAVDNAADNDDNVDDDDGDGDGDDDDAAATLRWSRFFAAVASPAASCSLTPVRCLLPAVSPPSPPPLLLGLASWHLKTFYARRALG